MDYCQAIITVSDHWMLANTTHRTLLRKSALFTIQQKSKNINSRIFKIIIGLGRSCVCCAPPPPPLSLSLARPDYCMQNCSVARFLVWGWGSNRFTYGIFSDLKILVTSAYMNAYMNT